MEYDGHTAPPGLTDELDGRVHDRLESGAFVGPAAYVYVVPVAHESGASGIALLVGSGPDDETVVVLKPGAVRFLVRGLASVMDQLDDD